MDTPNEKASETHDWSKVCHDLLRPILESLSDFHQAKTVCSDWYFVWKTCVKPLSPWRIIYEDDSLMLFDHRKEKIYKGTLVGLSDDSYYMASSGNWLLMVDSRLDFYIFNLLTRKRINLPSMESPIHKRINLSSSRKSSVLDGHTVRFKRSDEREYGEWGHFVEYGELGHLNEPCRKDYVSKENILGCKRSAVVWIDEKTKDYVVAWIFKQHYLFTYKKGDDSWWNWNSNWEIGGLNLGYMDVAYKNSMPYLYTSEDHIKMIDFSGDSPKEEIDKNPYRDHPLHYDSERYESISKRIVIQKSGEVLIILRRLQERQDPLFYVFKMNLKSGKWERVDSIGDDEMLIFGYGFTIRAPCQDVVGDGIKVVQSFSLVMIFLNLIMLRLQIAVSSILSQVRSHGLSVSVVTQVERTGLFQDFK